MAAAGHKEFVMACSQYETGTISCAHTFGRFALKNCAV